MDLSFNIDDHFRDLTKLIELGSEEKREITKTKEVTF